MEALQNAVLFQQSGSAA